MFSSINTLTIHLTQTTTQKVGTLAIKNKKLYQLLLVTVLLLITGCSKHQQCEKADIFDHCKKWQGQEVTCKRPILGFCRDEK